MIVYKAYNKINGKCYIGKTINTLRQRVNSHKSESNLGRYDIAFHRALRKYGFENFKWEILYKCISEEELNKIERYFIRKFDGYKNGYNETLGGDGQSIGYVTRRSTKRKLSAKIKQIWKDPLYRKKLSDKHKENWNKWYGTEKYEERILAMKKGCNSQKVKTIKSINAKKMWQKKGHKENIRKKLNKTWLIISDCGKKFIINDLTIWCKDHNINRFTFYGYKNKNKSWKGYFLRSMGGINE